MNRTDPAGSGHLRKDTPVENDLAIACRLSAPDLQDWLSDIRTVSLANVKHVACTESGFRLSRPNEDDQAGAILDVVRYQRQCYPCPDFGLTFPSHGTSDILLELTGPPNVQKFINVTFIANVTSGNAST